MQPAGFGSLSIPSLVVAWLSSTVQAALKIRVLVSLCTAGGVGRIYRNTQCTVQVATAKTPVTPKKPITVARCWCLEQTGARKGPGKGFAAAAKPAALVAVAYRMAQQHRQHSDTDIPATCILSTKDRYHMPCHQPADPTNSKPATVSSTGHGASQ